MRRLLPLALFVASCSGPEPNTRSKDPYERYLGVRVIGEERNQAEEAELLRLLDDPSYLVVWGVLESMAEISRKEYLPYALPKLKDANPMVRAQACETVSAVGGPEGLEPVLEALRSDSDAGVRRAAVKALGAHYPKDPKARQALVEAVGDRDPAISLNAHNELRQITGRQEVPRSKDAWAQALQP